MLAYVSGPLALAAPPGSPGSGGLFMVGNIVLIFAIMYFLVIAPQRRKTKLHSQMIDNLKSGDRVITNGGIYGTVVGIGDQIVQLRIADQVKIEVAKQAVAGLQQPES